jgi:hypothetical protein
VSVKIFATAEDLTNRFQEYMDYCIDTDRFPNIAGFCVYCKINVDTYYGYKEYKGYSDAIKSIDASLEDAVLNTKSQKDLIKLAYLNNKCGYSIKQEPQKVQVELTTADIEKERVEIQKILSENK